MQFTSSALFIFAATTMITVNAAPATFTTMTVSAAPPKFTVGPGAIKLQGKVTNVTKKIEAGTNKAIGAVSIVGQAGALAAKGAVAATGGAVIGAVAGATAGARAGWCISTNGGFGYVPCDPKNPPSTPPPRA
jgi:hypothetical protein